MRSSPCRAAAALATSATAASLADVCTVANVQAALPANGTLVGINMIPSSVTASPLYNVSTSTDTVSYCNVTVAYSRAGKNDVTLLYAFPSPGSFSNRFYVAGGEGYSLSSTSTGGLSYGAVGGASSAGYDALDGIAYDGVALYGNGSVNWDATYMFGYQALGEMTQIGKPLTKAFYGMSDDTKLYTVSPIPAPARSGRQVKC
jgi:tannase